MILSAFISLHQSKDDKSISRVSAITFQIYAALVIRDHDLDICGFDYPEFSSRITTHGCSKLLFRD